MIPLLLEFFDDFWVVPKSMNFIHDLFTDFCYGIDETERSYVCVHCGYPVKHLMKTYSPTVLQLVNCVNCGNVADKYLEYDDVIIWIDIILLNKQAYRHLLFNTKFQNHWKLALLILIAKTADIWLSFSLSQNVPLYLIKTSYENAIYAFCINFFIIILGESLFFCVISSFFLFFWSVPSCRSQFLNELSIIWKAVICSSFGYFLLLPSLIWSDFQREIHLTLIFVYTLLSHIQALTVVFKIQRPLLAGLFMAAILVNHGFCIFLRQCLSLTYNFEFGWQQ